MDGGNRRLILSAALFAAVAGSAYLGFALLGRRGDRAATDRGEATQRAAPAREHRARERPPEMAASPGRDRAPDPFDQDMTPEERARALPAWRHRFHELVESLRAAQTTSDSVRLAEEIERYVRTLRGDLGDRGRLALIELLRNTDNSAVLRRMGNSLGYTGRHVETEQQLLALLDENRNTPARSAALSAALAGVGDPSTARQLLIRLDGGRAPGAVHFIGAIGALRDADVEQELLAMLDNKLSANIRNAIERVWGRDGQDANVTRVLDRLGSGSAAAQSSCVRILGNTRNPNHGAKVRDVWDHSSNREIRSEALHAMSRIADAKSLTILLDVAVGSDPLSSTAERALRHLREPGAIVQAGERWEALSTTGRSALLGATRFVERPTPELLGVAERALGDEDATVRSNALLLLGRPNRAASVAPIARRLKESRNERECLAAVQALQSIGTAEARSIALDHVGKIPAAMRESYEEQLRRELQPASEK